MKFLRKSWPIIAGLIIVGCTGRPEESLPSNSKPPSENTLVSLEIQEDGYDIRFVEVKRGENYSLAEVELEEGTSVGSSMVLAKSTYEIAKQRGFEYFITTYPDGDESLLKIYFTNDNSVPLKELVGEDYSDEVQEAYDDVGYLSVSMFAPMFDKYQSAVEDAPTPTPQSGEHTTGGREDSVRDQAPFSPHGKHPGEVRSFAGMEFAWIPPGKFEMGSALSAEEVKRRYLDPRSDPEWYEDEHPRHTVTISRGFWLGRFEITNGDYRQFDPGHDSGNRDGFDLNHDDLPVVNVSWLDAQRYIEWLNGQKEGTFRLPTEAEWEYACRAGTTGVVYWGDLDESSGDYANVADQTFLTYMSDWITVPTTDGYVMAAPVGTFKPNEWGLHDMIGNVSEYCEDWWGPYTAEAQTDPKGPKSDVFRIERGGSCGTYPPGLRSASRQYQAPNDYSRHRGFRIVRVQE